MGHNSSLTPSLFLVHDHKQHLKGHLSPFGLYSCFLSLCLFFNATIYLSALDQDF